MRKLNFEVDANKRGQAESCARSGLAEGVVSRRSL